MRKIYIIILISTLIQSNCVTIPDFPSNKSPECSAYYFPIRKQLILHRENQWAATVGITYLSYIIGFAIGNDGLIPLLSIPFLVYNEYHSANKIYKEYIDLHCN